MKSWKRRTRARHKAEYRKWLNSESDNFEPRIKLYRKRWKLEDRQHRNRENDIRRETKTKRYYEDCASHPCLITELDIEGDDIRGVSLVDGSSPRSCSLHSCGVIFFTEEEAEARVEYIKAHGWDKYRENYNLILAEE